VAETGHALKVELPSDQVLLREMGYALHGAVSHFAIRRHVYGASRQILEERVVVLQVRLFVTGFAAMAAAARASEDDVVKLPRRTGR
jgi:hypothetical protein